MRGLLRDLVIYVIMSTAFTASLALLGESRADAYVAVSILVYFVSSSVLPNIRRYSDLRIVDAALVVMFIAIVVLRILEILGYSIPGVHT